MGRRILNALADCVSAPIALLGALTTGHRARLLVGGTKDIVFCTHDIVTGSVEANHNDERRKE